MGHCPSPWTPPSFDYELPTAAIAQTPVEPRDAARLLVDRGPGRRPTTPRPRPPVARRAGRRASWSTPPGCCRPGSAPPGRTGGAAEVLLLEPVGRRARACGRRWCGPAASSPPGTELEIGDDLRVIVGDDLGEGRRLVEVVHPLGQRPARRARPPRRGAAAAVHHRAARRSRALPDHLRRRTRVGGRADRRPAPHARGARAVRGRGRDAGHRRARRGARHVPPDRGRARRGPPDARRALPRPGGHLRRLRRAPSGWSPSAPPRCGRSSRPPPPASSRAAPTCSSTAPYQFAVVDALLTNFHQPRSSLLVLVEASSGRAGATSTPRRWPRATAS